MEIDKARESCLSTDYTITIIDYIDQAACTGQCLQRMSSLLSNTTLIACSIDSKVGMGIHKTHSVHYGPFSRSVHSKSQIPI